MPVIHVNAVHACPVAAGGGDLRQMLQQALAPLPRDAPILIMVHGFKYSPFRPGRSPHDQIFALRPAPGQARVVSWPRHLGLAQTGLCIGFGWEACGDLWRADAQAVSAGAALAQLVQLIRSLRAQQQVDAFAHSLGARVVLNALPDLPPTALRRAVLMTPAELSSRAAPALASPAGQRAEFLSVSSRENDLYDLLLERLLAPLNLSERSLSHSAPTHANWHDLQIDHPATLQALAGLGHRIAPPARRVCHWSPYLRPGMFGLYRAYLDGALPLSALPAHSSPRWSRLLAPPRVTLTLPFARKAPS